jgi:hypothetical protein
MMKGLVTSLHMERVQLGRHWLDALALAWQQQTRQIGPERLASVRMTDCHA